MRGAGRGGAQMQCNAKPNRNPNLNPAPNIAIVCQQADLALPSLQIKQGVQIQSSAKATLSKAADGWSDAKATLNQAAGGWQAAAQKGKEVTPCMPYHAMQGAPPPVCHGGHTPCRSVFSAMRPHGTPQDIDALA